MEKYNNNKIFFGIDLIKCLATIFVVFVHAYLYSQFYNTKIDGGFSFMLIFIREFLICCVPLFMITTGYLQKNTEINSKYYSKIKKILVAYFSISVITAIYRKLYLNRSMSLFSLFYNIFNYTTIGSAWYIEMYIGLFLLIPFLNILYNNIKLQKQKILLIITLFFLTSVSSTTAYMKIGKISFDIFPNWWVVLYPIFYFYIGRYIREYRPNINKVINVIILLSSVFITSFLAYFYLHNLSYDDIGIMDYNGVPIVLNSVLIFLLLYNVNINGTKIKGMCRKISEKSLNIYLFAYIYENIFYSFIFKTINVKGYTKFIVAICIVAPIVFICSLISSFVLQFFINLFSKIINYFVVKHKKKYNLH